MRSFIVGTTTAELGIKHPKAAQRQGAALVARNLAYEPPSNMIPTAIELHKTSRQLELRYANGKQVWLDAEYLRVYSPSAEVRGHHPSQAVLQSGKRNTAIQSISMVGNYALQINFDDGHSSGIYSWEYLEELGEKHTAYWQDYLDRIRAAGKTRDPLTQVIRID